MKADNRTLEEWLIEVDNAQIKLPRFQRHEAWSKKMVGELMTSILNNISIGSALVLEVRGEEPFISRYLEGAKKEKSKFVNELLLDGQQRLTGIWRSLNNNYPDRTYLVYLSEESETADGSYKYEVYYEPKTKKWINKPTKVWEKGSIPIHVLKPGSDGEEGYNEWVSKAAETAEEEIAIRKKTGVLREIISSYTLPYLRIPFGTDKSVVIDTFVRINTKNVKLTAFDILVAQMEAILGESLHGLVRDTVDAVSSLSTFYMTSDLDEIFDGVKDDLLKASALLQNERPETRTLINFGKEEIKKIKKDWDVITFGLDKTIDFLLSEGVFDTKRLPTSSVLPVLIALFGKAKNLKPSALGNAKFYFRKYIWRAFLTDRYESSVPTNQLEDYKGLKYLIFGDKSESEPPCFNDSNYPFPNDDLIRSADWPHRKDPLGRALLVVFLKAGSKDLKTSTKVNSKNIKTREYHHLYAKEFLKSKGVKEKEWDKALNCALVEYESHDRGRQKKPYDMLLTLTGSCKQGKTEINKRLKTHLIPVKAFEAGKYDDFIRARAELAKKGLSALWEGKDWEG